MALGYPRTSIAKYQGKAIQAQRASRRDGVANAHWRTVSRAPKIPVFPHLIADRQAHEPGVFSAPYSLAQEHKAALQAGLVPMNGPCNASFLD